MAFAVQDLELVASELNSFCEGKHPMFPGLARLADHIKLSRLPGWVCYASQFWQAFAWMEAMENQTIGSMSHTRSDMGISMSCLCQTSLQKLAPTSHLLFVFLRKTRSCTWCWGPSSNLERGASRTSVNTFTTPTSCPIHLSKQTPLQDVKDRSLAFFQQHDLPVKKIISGTCHAQRSRHPHVP